jgi:hypothetical protein
MRDAEAGDELWTTMDGVDALGLLLFFVWARSELRRDRERDSCSGGGDFNLGEMGQCGVVSPEFVPDEAFAGRGTREGSCEEVGGSEGMLAADNALWMAAADGTVVLEPARLGPLLGLTSVLLFRDRRPDFGIGPAEAGWRWWWCCCCRWGELSRDDKGEFAVDPEPVTASERGP